MLINTQTLQDLQVMVSGKFNEGKTNATAIAAQIASFINSGSSQNLYPDFSQMPGFREWVGDRVFNDMSKGQYAVPNKTYESSIQVKREDIEDDNLGWLAHFAKAQGQVTTLHADKILLPMLAGGFNTQCHDGENFFSTEHAGPNGTKQSNFLEGTGRKWYLVDNTQALMPLIFQKRREYTLTSKINLNDDNVFHQNVYQWGIDARVAGGYGPWFTAFGSGTALDAANYADARARMADFESPEGNPFGTQGKLLIVGPQLEAAGRELLLADRGTNGKTNIWRDSATLLVVPGL